MQTFAEKLDKEATDSRREILLIYQEKAPAIASRGLGRLLEEARIQAKSDVKVSLEIQGIVDRCFMVEFLERVRRHVPVDVHVYWDGTHESDGRVLFYFEPGLYGEGESNGKLEYDFPYWRKTNLGVLHNLKHLEKEGVEGDEVDVFERILRIFGCFNGEIGQRLSGVPLAVSIEILDRALTWSQKNMSTAVVMELSQYREMFAYMAAGADIPSQVKYVKVAYADLFSPSRLTNLLV